MQTTESDCRLNNYTCSKWTDPFICLLNNGQNDMGTCDFIKPNSTICKINTTSECKLNITDYKYC